ncbi:MAG: Uma2 family endonuclease [Candidatus Saccharimonas sp.]|nr:Uma2 family endonuclease [Planctomycetaceae bacterium]
MAASTLEIETGERLYEMIGGQRREIEPMGAYSGLLASMLTYLLTDFVITHRLGWVVTEVLFVLDASRGLHRRPDVAFVDYDRCEGPPALDDNPWDTVPDLAVEVISPSNTSEEIDRKVVDYFAAGVRLVWVLHPETRRLHVYESVDTIHVVGSAGTVGGGTVLAGFQLVLGELFDSVEKPVG